MVTGAPSQAKIAPPQLPVSAVLVAWLLRSVLSTIVVCAPGQRGYSAPPLSPWLPSSRLAVIVSGPVLTIAPPLALALLLRIVLWSTVRLPRLLIAPPSSGLNPSVSTMLRSVSEPPLRTKNSWRALSPLRVISPPPSIVVLALIDL